MKEYRVSFVFTIILTLIGVFPLNAQILIDSVEGLEEEVDYIFQKYNHSNTPGATIAIMLDGKVVFSKGYGIANLEYDIPNTKETIFHVASVSKQFTVFAILLLDDQKKLSIDDDIRKYIPELRDFGHTITLRHLASHTSGLRDQWTLLNMAGWRFDDVITQEHILNLLYDQKDLNFIPGEKYMYSNSGFTLLAEVVRRVSGFSFVEFTTKFIFKPLKMNNTFFYDNHEKIVKDRAYSYESDEAGLKKSVMNFANVGATSLFTTAEDLCIWSNNFKEIKIGSDKIVKLMDTPSVLNNGDTISYALGQFVETYNGVRHIQHGGADAGYRSYLGRFPDHDLSIAVLSNYSKLNTKALTLNVADLFLEKNLEKKALIKEKEHQFEAVNHDDVKNILGHYWDAEGGYVREIVIENDTLRYIRPESMPSNLLQIGKNEFKMMNVGIDIITKFSEENGRRSMSLLIEGAEPISYDWYSPVVYAMDGLLEFQGTYYSDELTETYSINLENDVLVVNMNKRGFPIILTPLMKDLFLGDHRYFQQIEFVRNKENKLIGLSISSARVKNLFFRKE